MIEQTLNRYQTVTSVPDEVWEGFVEREPTGHFLQTAAWGRFKSEWGWYVRRVAVRREGILTAGAQLLFRRLPLGRTVAYLPRGPVLPPDDPVLLESLLDVIHQLCREEGALLLTVEPNWSLPAKGARQLTGFGFRPSANGIQPSATITLDLRPPEEEILAQMHRKWRYNIRLSGRKEVEVRTGSEADFKRFHDLLQVTGSRDTFAIRPQQYYQDVWRAFGPERCKLFIAEYAERPLAGIMVVKVGTMATYLYGASSNEERNRMPNHALQWAAMQWAKQVGCSHYDFWGIPPEVPMDGKVETYGEGGLWGVFRFKQGFGGEIVKYPGAFDYPYSRLGYLAYQMYQARRGGE